MRWLNMILSNITLLLLITLVLISIGVYINALSLKKKNKALNKEGLSFLKKLRVLLGAIQQHRGLTMGYINGDKTLLKRISPIKQKINSQIADIEKQNNWDKNNLIWMGIADHWSRLSNNYENHDSKYNFTQHCNLIMNLLNLIEESAEKHHLHELTCSNQLNANFLWGQLLKSAEYIGQARAVGTSIAAAKKSTSVERIKLNYLKNRIEEFANNKDHQIETHLIHALLHSINKEILIDLPKISANDYFNQSTEAIDLILTKFDNYLDELAVNY